MTFPGTTRFWWYFSCILQFFGGHLLTQVTWSFFPVSGNMEFCGGKGTELLSVAQESLGLPCARDAWTDWREWQWRAAEMTKGWSSSRMTRAQECWGCWAGEEAAWAGENILPMCVSAWRDRPWRGAVVAADGGLEVCEAFAFILLPVLMNKVRGLLVLPLCGKCSSCQVRQANTSNTVLQFPWGGSSATGWRQPGAWVLRH